MPGLSYIVLCIHCCSSQGARVPLNSVVRNAPLFEHEKSLSIVVTHGSRNLDSLFHRIHCRCSSFEIRPPSQRRAENQYLQLNHSLWNCGSFLSVCTCVREAYLNWLRRERDLQRNRYAGIKQIIFSSRFSIGLLKSWQTSGASAHCIPSNPLGRTHIKIDRSKMWHWPSSIEAQNWPLPYGPWWKRGWEKYWFVLFIEWCR